jgi:hydroxymethylpyrimidine pyrophosphatase-like HAD family hydrolase
VAGDDTTAMFIKMSRDLPTTYVTGRNIRELTQGIAEYGLTDLIAPYAGVDTGLHMYERLNNEFRFDRKFKDQVVEYVDVLDWSKNEYFRILGGYSESEVFLTKDDETQDPKSLKVQWTVVNVSRLEDFTKEIQRAVEQISPSAGVVISSFDKAKNRGFIDLMPLFNFNPDDQDSQPVTGKVIATEYIRRKMGLQPTNVAFAGDSGNDSLALAYGYKGILIENASPSVVNNVRQLAENAGTLNRIIMPNGQWGPFTDGRCLRGVIRGVAEHAGVTADVLFDGFRATQ